VSFGLQRCLRERHGFGCGKFDYVMIDGVPFVLDVNKNVGCQ
jgi:hypothetical protein